MTRTNGAACTPVCPATSQLRHAQAAMPAATVKSSLS